MKHKIIVMIYTFFSVFIFSCSQPQPQPQYEDAKDAKSPEPEKVQTERKLDTDKNLLLNKLSLKTQTTALNSNNRRTIYVNGEKYILEGDKLQKGSVIRNINMSEKGIVKGSLVIVTQAVDLLALPIRHKEKIAKSTFRVFPNESEDLQSFYNALSENKLISIVELEIDYGKEQAEIY